MCQVEGGTHSISAPISYWPASVGTVSYTAMDVSVVFAMFSGTAYLLLFNAIFRANDCRAVENSTVVVACSFLLAG